MKKDRIYYFDNLKFLLIFLVVFGHFIELYVNVSYNAKVLWTFIYTFHMPLFIFVSGYFSKKQIETEDYKKTYKYISLYYIMKILHFLIDKYIFCNNSNLNILTINNIEWYLFALAIWPAISIKTKKIQFKKKLLFSIIISLIIGFDPFFKDFLCLSRIIVFYPFFLIGNNFNQNKINKIKNKKNIILSLLILILIFLVYYFNIDFVYKIRPILTGRNNYNILNESIRNYGIIIRSGWYIFSIFISILIMIVIPKQQNFITKYGERTLSVYFWHAFIFYIIKYLNIYLNLHQCLILAIIVTLVLSLNIFYIPVKKTIDYI